MVCVPQPEEQPFTQPERVAPIAAAADAEFVADAAADVEELTAACIVRDHTENTRNVGPITIFVKSTSTVDDLYEQIATQFKLNNGDFEINLRSEPLYPKPTKLIDAGIKFGDDRNNLTLTTLISKSKRNLLRLNKALENMKSETVVVDEPVDVDVPARTSDVVEKKYVGLVNQAMTCYLNSLLQSLFMTPEFRNALYKWEFDGRDEEARRKSIPFQLQRLFLKLQTSGKNAIETTDLTRSFGWDSSDSWTQHDVQELCRVMFDALEHKFRKTEQADLINRLYQGKMIDYVKCMECGKENIREDTFLDIPLPIRPFGKETAYGSVEEALSGFVEPETLDGANQYACENCNKKCDAKKGLKFVNVPYLLTLHLMRFDFDYNSLHRLKLNDKVVFPEILDMNPYICTPVNKESQEHEVVAENSDPQLEQPAAVAEIAAVENAEPVVSNNGDTVTVVEPPLKTDQPQVTGAPVVNGEVIVEAASKTEQPPQIEVAPVVVNGVEAVEPALKTELLQIVEDPVVNGKENPQSNGKDIVDDVFENEGAAAVAEVDDNNEINRRRSVEKGPFMYELYAILIHSGNASGGHYYAYIKDFITGQWFCFNDQNVSGITTDDIKKTYGGSRSYYSSGYSPSTSAYMLMYRQIDKERNVEVMKIEEFPDHIKALLAAMQNREGVSWDPLMDTVKLKVYCYLPNGDRQTHCKINCLGSLKLLDVMKIAQTELGLQSSEYPLENCRLVSYNGTHHQVLGGFHKHSEDTIANIVNANDGNQTFLLQIKSTDEPWQPFTLGDAIARIYSVDVETEKFEGPYLLPLNCKMDGTEFKGLVQKHLSEKFGAVPAEQLTVVLEKYSSECLCALNDYSRVFESDSYICTVKKVFVSVNTEPEKPFLSTQLFKLIDRFQNIIGLEISLPDLDTEDLEEQEIPLLSSTNRTAQELVEADPESELEAAESAPAPTTPAAAPTPPPVAQSAEGAEEDQAASTDQSASEDSSLTDSDRTLVGDQENLLVQLSGEESSGQAVSSPDDPPPDKSSKDEESWGDGETSRVSHARQQSYTYFKATPYTVGSTKMLKIEVDKRASMAWLKRHLEVFVGVPCDYFKVVKSNDEYDYTSLTPSFRDGDRINVRLGRVLRKGEYLGKVFQLVPNDPEPIKFLTNCTLSNGMLVSEAKKQILRDLKRKNNIEMIFERCRLRKKSWKNPGQVYYDHQKFEESMCLMSSWELFLQEMPENWPQRNAEDPLPELVLFVRKLSPSELTIGPFEEVELPSTSGQELNAKLSEMSGIPAEEIEIAKAVGSFPCDASLLTVNAELEWISGPTTLNEWPFNIYEDGHVILYRDRREPVKELTTEERREMEKAERKAPRNASSWSFTPRKERGLRIYLDPTPPKSTAPIEPTSEL